MTGERRKGKGCRANQVIEKRPILPDLACTHKKNPPSKIGRPSLPGGPERWPGLCVCPATRDQKGLSESLDALRSAAGGKKKPTKNNVQRIGGKGVNACVVQGESGFLGDEDPLRLRRGGQDVEPLLGDSA